MLETPLSLAIGLWSVSVMATILALFVIVLVIDFTYRLTVKRYFECKNMMPFIRWYLKAMRRKNKLERIKNAKINEGF